MVTVDLSHQILVEFLLGDPPSQNALRHLTYHEGDKIAGTILIKSNKDVQLSGLDLHFLGYRFLSVALNITPRFRSLILYLGEETTSVQYEKTVRQFLNMRLSCRELAFPPNRLFRRNQSYHFQFAFDVPDRLPDTACHHGVCHDHIHKTHLQLPPSFGNPSVARFRGRLSHDFAPLACKIVYKIQVNLNSASYIPGKQQVVLQKSIELQIIPTRDLDPLMPTHNIDHYCLQQITNIRTSRLNPVSGQLTARLIAPACFFLSLDEATEYMRDTIRIHLRYEKNEHNEPLPQIKTLRGRVLATTLFTNSFHRDIPTKQKHSSDAVIITFSRSIASLQWTSDKPNCFLATLLLPIKCSDRLIIPTFHSCRISRIYTLEVQLKLHGAPALKLTAPMQIQFRKNEPVLPSYIE